MIIIHQSKTGSNDSVILPGENGKDYKYAVNASGQTYDPDWTGDDYEEHALDLIAAEGKELPDIGVNELTGDVKDYRKLFNALVSICPVPMRFEDIQGGAKGYYNDAEKRIAIKEGISQIQTIKVMIHEMAHQKLHAKDVLDPDHPIDRRTKEVEAESIAYTVCSRYGLDISDYSFGYVAGWSSGRETRELKDSLERIRTAADEMITGIDQQVEKQMKREQRRHEQVR